MTDKQAIRELQERVFELQARCDTMRCNLAALNKKTSTLATAIDRLTRNWQGRKAQHWRRIYEQDDNAVIVQRGKLLDIEVAK